MSTKPSRRAFTHLAVTASVAPLVVSADEPARQPHRPPLSVSADALVEIVKSRHGKRLTDEQLRSIRRRILHGLEMGERLRKMKLTNADEPAFTFSADVP